MYNDDSSELEKQCELQAQQKMAGKSREECFVNNEAEAIEIAKNMPIEDFNWSEDVEFDVLDFE